MQMPCVRRLPRAQSIVAARARVAVGQGGRHGRLTPTRPTEWQVRGEDEAAKAAAKAKFAMPDEVIMSRMKQPGRSKEKANDSESAVPAGSGTASATGTAGQGADLYEDREASVYDSLMSSVLDPISYLYRGRGEVDWVGCPKSA